MVVWKKLQPVLLWSVLVEQHPLRPHCPLLHPPMPCPHTPRFCCILLQEWCSGGDLYHRSIIASPPLDEHWVCTKVGAQVAGVAGCTNSGMHN